MFENGEVIICNILQAYNVDFKRIYQNNFRIFVIFYNSVLIQFFCLIENKKQNLYLVKIGNTLSSSIITWLLGKIHLAKSNIYLHEELVLQHSSPRWQMSSDKENVTQETESVKGIIYCHNPKIIELYHLNLIFRYVNQNILYFMLIFFLIIART